MPHRTFDQIEVRCPLLGGEVTFGYCRKLADGLPCHKALVCFAMKFPVAEYFRRLLKPETFQKVFLSPQPERMEKLLKVVGETVERTKEKEKKEQE